MRKDIKIPVVRGIAVRPETVVEVTPITSRPVTGPILVSRLSKVVRIFL